MQFPRGGGEVIPNKRLLGPLDGVTFSQLD